MCFDFEGRNFDTPTIESAISWREQMLVSVFGHLVFVLLVLFVPRLEFFENIRQQRLERLAEQAELLQQQRLAMAQPPTDESFVFIAPRVDIEADAPPRPDAPPSDMDRIAQSPLRTLDPESRLPVAEGNTSEFVESNAPDEEFDPLAARDLESVVEDTDATEPSVEADPDENRLVDATAGQGETEESPDTLSDTPGTNDEDRPGANQFADSSLSQPGAGRGDPDDSRTRPELRADGLLGGARRTLQRSLQQQTFGNVSGDTGRYGPTIQFDSKGIDFGPWIRRFQAQIYRNWFVPYRVLTDSGHVVLTFNIHRNGSMTDLTVVQPSVIDPFNHSAANALRMSNPTQPLPGEYPDEQAFFTVTFYFNETPPRR